jgi:hypothetical protein
VLRYAHDPSHPSQHPHATRARSLQSMEIASGEQQRRHRTDRESMDSTTLQTLQDPILLLPWVCFRGGGFPNTGFDVQRRWRAAERRHRTNHERMGSTTLQTLQDPILLLPWVWFRGGGFPNPNTAWRLRRRGLIHSASSEPSACTTRAERDTVRRGVGGREWRDAAGECGVRAHERNQHAGAPVAGVRPGRVRVVTRDVPAAQSTVGV